MKSQVVPFKTIPERMKIADTNDGRETDLGIADLELLPEAYLKGTIKQGTE